MYFNNKKKYVLSCRNVLEKIVVKLLYPMKHLGWSLLALPRGWLCNLSAVCTGYNDDDAEAKKNNKKNWFTVFNFLKSCDSLGYLCNQFNIGNNLKKLSLMSIFVLLLVLSNAKYQKFERFFVTTYCCPMTISTIFWKWEVEVQTWDGWDGDREFLLFWLWSPKDPKKKKS